MARRPRLPMFLGLATLTAGAHAIVAGAHLFGGHADTRDWPLLALLALAPVVAVVLAIRGRGRHGALTLTVTMALAAWWTLYSHFRIVGDDAAPELYAWIIQLMLAFELQGAAVGVVLAVKPEVPRARAEAAG